MADKLKVSEMTRVDDSAFEVKLGTSIPGVLCAPISLLCCCFGFFTLDPNQHAVILNSGVPIAVVKEPGCHYSNCCLREIQTISTAQVSYDLAGQKILDKNGNPLIVSAVVTYRFTDAIKARLQVKDAEGYVRNQASAALKLVVGRFTYDELLQEGSHISKEIINTLQPRVDITGAVISNVTLNELNYAPEIATAMLKKQQAAALVEARHLIVRGAVEISQQAVAALEEGGIKLTPHEKANLITSLLTVTTGDKDPSPVLNVGQ